MSPERLAYHELADDWPTRRRKDAFWSCAEQLIERLPFKDGSGMLRGQLNALSADERDELRDELRLAYARLAHRDLASFFAPDGRLRREQLYAYGALLVRRAADILARRDREVLVGGREDEHLFERAADRAPSGRRRTSSPVAQALYDPSACEIARLTSKDDEESRDNTLRAELELLLGSFREPQRTIVRLRARGWQYPNIQRHLEQQLGISRRLNSVVQSGVRGVAKLPAHLRQLFPEKNCHGRRGT